MPVRIGGPLTNADIHIEYLLEFITIDGIGSYLDYHYAYGDQEIHAIDFSVFSDGVVQLDILKYGVLTRASILT